VKISAIFRSDVTIRVIQPMALSEREGHNLVALVPFWDCCLGTQVIAVSSLIKFWARYPDSGQALKAWYTETKSASWRSPADVKVLYRSASVLKKDESCST
jgi:hypothetical protein